MCRTDLVICQGAPSVAQHTGYDMHQQPHPKQQPSSCSNPNKETCSGCICTVSQPHVCPSACHLLSGTQAAVWSHRPLTHRHTQRHNATLLLVWSAATLVPHPQCLNHSTLECARNSMPCICCRHSYRVSTSRHTAVAVQSSTSMCCFFLTSHLGAACCSSSLSHRSHTANSSAATCLPPTIMGRTGCRGK